MDRHLSVTTAQKCWRNIILRTQNQLNTKDNEIRTQRLFLLFLNDHTYYFACTFFQQSNTVVAGSIAAKYNAQ
jgi:hypothetical protein